MRLSVVIPCYNEADVICITHERLLENLTELVTQHRIDDYEILYVDDGSSDTTPVILRKLFVSNENVIILTLSRNSGHQKALLAGLHHASGNVIASLDADLQDPPEILGKMLEKISSGCDIVYGVRSDRGKDSLFKRSTAGLFYRLMSLLGTELIPEHADFRMFNRKVQRSLKRHRERKIFLRGLFPAMGFRSEKRIIPETNGRPELQNTAYHAC